MEKVKSYFLILIMVMTTGMMAQTIPMENDEIDIPDIEASQEIPSPAEPEHSDKNEVSMVDTEPASSESTITISASIDNDALKEKLEKAKELSDGSSIMSGHVVIEKDEVRSDDLVIFGGSAEVFGSILGDLVVFGGKCDLDGMIKGDVVTFGGKLNIQENAQIKGNLVTISGDTDVHENAQIDGEIVNASGVPIVGQIARWIGSSSRLSEIELEKTHDDDSNLISGYNMVALLWWLVIGFFFVMLFGRNIEQTGNMMQNESIKTFLFGFLFHISTLILVLIFTISILGIPLVPIVVLLWIAVGIFGVPVGFIVMGRKILQLRNKEASILAQFIVGFIVLGLIRNIPFGIGLAVWHLWAMAGIGATIISKFGLMTPWFRRGSYPLPPSPSGSSPHHPITPTPPPESHFSNNIPDYTPDENDPDSPSHPTR